jgi:hypothetical protein
MRYESYCYKNSYKNIFKYSFKIVLKIVTIYMFDILREESNLILTFFHN